MAEWNPYSLKKPCKNCPFLKDKSKAIQLDPARVPGIINDLVTGEASSFSCHKTVYHSKTGGRWVDDDSDEGGHYEQSGLEKQCAGSLIVMEKMGKQTTLMQVMQRMGQYNPDDFKPYYNLVIDPSPDT